MLIVKVREFPEFGELQPCVNIILRVTAYSGELLSPTSVTKTGYTGFWLVSDINRRKLVTSSENSERATLSVRSNSISYGHILNL